ncbi:MAG: hypothetical protein HY075_00420 [Deltaproteobacteria bacterium]|nr:hypothetical protein [Deltaproteobacteria bacterium]
MAETPAPSAKISVVEPADYERVAAYLAAYPGEKRAADVWRERFGLWWEGNPAFGGDVERGWVLRDGERVVGFLGNVPTWFQTPRGVVRGYTASTWRVDEPYRKKSVSLYLRQVANAREGILFNTTANENVKSVLEALSFSKLPPSRTGKNTFLALRFPLSLAQAPLLAWLALGAARAGGEVREVTRADSAFDTLWDSTRGLYPFTSVRSSQVLNWFCFSAPAFSKRLLGYYEDGRLLGYVACFSSDWRGYRVWECLDLWAVGGERRVAVTRALVRAAIAAAGRETFFVLPHFSADLADVYGPLGRAFAKPSVRRHYYKAGGDGVEAPREDAADQVYFSALEGDLAL